MCIQNHEYAITKPYNKVIIYRFLEQLDGSLRNKGIKREFFSIFCALLYRTSLRGEFSLFYRYSNFWVFQENREQFWNRFFVRCYQEHWQNEIHYKVDLSTLFPKRNATFHAAFLLKKSVQYKFCYTAFANPEALLRSGLKIRELGGSVFFKLQKFVIKSVKLF